MTHTAFRLFSLDGTNITKAITSVAVWGNTLFVGIHGRLLTYTITYKKDAISRFSAKLTKETKNFGKNIQQMCVVPDLGILISLVDGTIKLNFLSSLREISVLTHEDFYKKTRTSKILKNVTLFSLKRHNGEWRLIVCFKKKKVFIMRYDFKLNSFYVEKRINLSDSPKTANWCKEKILIGYTKEYALIDMEGKTEVIKCPTSQVNTLMMTTQTENIIKIHKKAITYNFDGKPNRRWCIDFGDEPKTFSYLQPYLIASLGSFLQINLLFEDQLEDIRTQSIDLKEIRTHSQPNFIDFDGKKIDNGIGIGYREKSLQESDDIYYQYRVFLCSKNKIFVLTMKNFALQIKEIQKRKHFKDALNLANILQGTNYEIPKTRIDDIHMEYGFNLFLSKSYKKAMNHFSKTSRDPRIVLTLFGKMFDTSTALPLPFGRPEDRQRAINQLDDQDNKYNALRALVGYLSRERSKEDKKNRNDWMEDVDTTILKALLILKDKELRNFIEGPNDCSIEKGERYLEEFKKYLELVLFYKSKNQHSKALNLLKMFGKKMQKNKDYSLLNGVEPTINYLRDIENKALILEYSKWVLQKDHLKSVQIFTHKNTPFTISEVLKFFEKDVFSKKDESIKTKLIILEMKIKFLEFQINFNGNKDPEIHNSMILRYKEHIALCEKSEGKDLPNSPFGSDENIDSIVNKNNYMNEVQPRILLMKKSLRRFLKSSRYYEANKIIKNFHSDKMFKERAILLSRLNKHKEALQIYVHDIKDQKAAEKYCIRCYNNSNEKESQKDIFLTLLSINLHPTKETDKIYTEESIKILEKYYNKIDIIKAVKLLPNSITLYQLRTFFLNSLRNHLKKYRNVKIVKNLANSELNQTKAELAKETDVSFAIDNKVVCPKCRKRIGLSAFVRQTNGKIYHLNCAKELLLE